MKCPSRMGCPVEIRGFGRAIRHPRWRLVQALCLAITLVRLRIEDFNREGAEETGPGQCSEWDKRMLRAALDSAQRAAAAPRKDRLNGKAGRRRLSPDGRPPLSAGRQGLQGLRTCPPRHLPPRLRAPSPERMARAPTSVGLPAPPTRGFAARVAAPEHTGYCEERKRRRGKPERPGAWAGELRLAAHHHGRGWETLQGSITIVGRRQIEARMSLQNKWLFPLESGCSRVLYRVRYLAGALIPLGRPLPERPRATNLELVSQTGPRRRETRTPFGLAPGGVCRAPPVPGERCASYTPFTLACHAVCPRAPRFVSVDFPSSISTGR